MVGTINIRIEGQHGSISDLEWRDVPPFAVLTGVNGAGKSQLLEILAASHNALRSRAPRSDPPAIQARAHIEDDSFSAGEVFHSYGEWPLLAAGGATEDQVKGAIRELYGYRTDESFWRGLADGLGISVEQAKGASQEDFYKYLTPGLLWGHRLPMVSQNLSFLFLAYRLFERDALAHGMTEDRVRQLYGEPPWDLMNGILEASGLPFRASNPEFIRPSSLVYSQQFLVSLRDTERGADVPFDGLSSGEKVLMSTALWRYGAEQVGKHYRLLLLDEPDAHLHPSLTRRFLNVIQQVFVEERGVRVILSTHSPSTVALAPAESLFEMRRTVPRIRAAPSKEDIIAVLTGGFIAVQEATRTVLVEGKDDPPFYQLVWDLLTERSAVSDPGPLDPYPNISFIFGQGKVTVELLVPQMRSRGLTSFYGIIDRDTGNAPSAGVHVLDRNGMENYLFDPLNVWVLLHDKDKAPDVPGVSIPRGRGAYVRNLPVDQLQAIVDTVLSTVEASLPAASLEGQKSETVPLVGEKSLQYPRWFLHRDDHEIKGQFRTVFGQHLLTDANLLRSYAVLNMIPADLLTLFKTIQAGGPAVVET